jgi:ferredoxin
LAPELFEVDENGNGRVCGDGIVPAGLLDKAHLAQSNCPEIAIRVAKREI